MWTAEECEEIFEWSLKLLKWTTCEAVGRSSCAAADEASDPGHVSRLWSTGADIVTARLTWPARLRAGDIEQSRDGTFEANSPENKGKLSTVHGLIRRDVLTSGHSKSFRRLEAALQTALALSILNRLYHKVKAAHTHSTKMPYKHTSFPLKTCVV